MRYHRLLERDALVRLTAILLFPLSLAACDPGERAAEADDEAATTPEGPARMAVEGAGLSTPESVLHDEDADVYFVSNINGEPLGKAGNGFISRIRPDGEVETLRWVDGEQEGITLHAPKGMALIGDTLFVADIDTVRAFHRTTGATLGARGVPGASFLNDLAAGPDGALYVSDTGLDASFAPTGTDAVYRFGADGLQVIARGPGLMNPNGLLADGNAVIMVPFGGSTVYRIPVDGGTPQELATLPAGQLDGVVRADDGALLVSSWEGGAVYRIAPDGSVTTAVDGLEAPADIGWDSSRQRLLIPLFMGDAVQIRRLP